MSWAHFNLHSNSNKLAKPTHKNAPANKNTYITCLSATTAVPILGRRHSQQLKNVRNARLKNVPRSAKRYRTRQARTVRNLLGEVQ